MLSWAFGGVAGAWSATRLVHRFDGRWPLAIGGALMALGLGGIAAAHAHPWEMVVWLAAAGIGFAQSAVGAITVIVSSVEPSETGVATGMSTVIRQVGGTVGAELMAALLAASVVAGTQVPTEGAFQLTFALCAGGAALSAVLGAFALPRSGGPRSARHVADAVPLGESPAPVLAAH